MDRVSRSLALCSFGLLLTTAGCRSTRPEVPPGRPYSSDGRQRPAIGFSTDPHPIDGSAMTNIVPDSPGASKMAQGLGAGSSPSNLPPALGSYGQPTLGGQSNVGTGGTVAQSSRTSALGDESVVPVGAPTLPRQSISPYAAPVSPPAAGSATLPPDAEPRPDPATPASQAVQPDLQGGEMGAPGAFPSPN